MAAVMLQANPGLYTKFSEKTSFFLQLHIKSTLFVQTTASPITTTRRVLYQLASIIFYYVEKLRTCYISWIRFVSLINTWTVYIPCSNTDAVEKLLQRVEVFLTMCRGQSLLTRESEGWTKCRVLQKSD